MKMMILFPKRYNQQKLQPTLTSQNINTLLSGIQYQYFDDSSFLRDSKQNMTNALTLSSDESLPTNGTTQTPIKPTSTQSLPSIFAHCKVFENFFLPSKTFSTIPFFAKLKMMIMFSPLFIHG